MRKQSQHYQSRQIPPPNMNQKCQDTTKKFIRLNQIKSKHDFLDWLKSLPFEIRYLAIKVEAPGLAESIRQILKRLDFKNEILQAKKATHKIQKSILDSLVFSSDGKEFFDSICFDFHYIEYPEKLYDLLMYSGESVKKFNPIEDMQKNRKPMDQCCQQIKNCQSKEKLCNILVRVLRHEVFFNTCNKQEIQITDEKNRKKQLSFYWKNLSQQIKYNILYLKKLNIKELCEFLTENNAPVQLEELEKEINHLIKLQKNQFCNRIFKCKLKNSLSSITDYHHLIYRLWKSEFQLFRTRRSKKFSHFSFMKPYNSNLLYQTQKHQITQILPNQKQGSVDSFETNETEACEPEAFPNGRLKDWKLDEFINKKIQQNVAEFSNYISKEANIQYQARLVAFQRIKFILESYGIPIKLFGSCANGIAIKNSDIDIAVDNSIVNYFNHCQDQNKIAFSLEWLFTVLSSFKCMKNIKLIKTAAIPIIKLTIDTQENFQLDQTLFSFDVTQYMKYLNRSHKQSSIDIDITVETRCQNLKCNHLGINTTKKIHSWTQQIKPLKYIIIIIKYFLYIQDLNNTYKDGINTYGMVVMLVATIRHLKLQKEQNVAVMLEKVLHFLTNQFDPKQYGIDLRNKKQIFYKKSQNTIQSKSEYTKADLEVLDPENDGQNMTRKCYKYQLIKLLFQQIEKRCFSEFRKIIISNFLKDDKLRNANLQNQNFLKKQSLIEIAKNIQNPFIQLVKENSMYQKADILSIEEEKINENVIEGMELLKTQSISN